ncbi:MAG: zinc ribbon domain-containing protein [bacterium]
MPVYEYKCNDCGHHFEVDQRIVDPPLHSCQMCGGSVERLISRCSFILKGGGWYATDNPSPDRKKSIAKEKKSNGTTSETKSDTVSENKTGSKAAEKAPSSAAAAASA